jgi:hypothetical protein
MMGWFTVGRSLERKCVREREEVEVEKDFFLIKFFGHQQESTRCPNLDLEGKIVSLFLEFFRYKVESPSHELTDKEKH